jgi:NAD(P)-dependent dehydrogenase (short-subunit alcohol dehydrogenase family)
VTKSVLITGASSGFGSDVAVSLARDGWHVFAAMRSLAKGKALEDRLQGEPVSGRIEPIELDVTDLASVERGVEHVANISGGSLDALLNNAGYSIFGAFEDLSDADCRQQMETNFYGALNVTRAVLPLMRVAGKGRIAIVTSNAVNSPHPMLTMYAASKWALEGWAEGLAMEVAPFGVEVVVVQPGAHRTPFAQNVVPVVPETSAYGRWMESIGPAVANLDRWGRDPARATATLVDAVRRPDMRFRTALGEDSAIFAALKGALPYEARALLLRAIINAPAPGAFSSAAPALGSGTVSEIAAHLHNQLDPATIAELADMLVEASRGRIDT